MKKYTLEIPKGYKKIPLPGRDEWLKALRSGKYKQTDGALRKQEEYNDECQYCCLGVLSKIQGRLTDEGCDLFEREDGDSVLHPTNPFYSIFEECGYLPENVKFIDDRDVEHISLTTINDHGYTFTQIADVIEAVWENKRLVIILIENNT